MYNPFSLDGKTILVTGASSGIGKSIAIMCSRMGASVILCARREARLRETEKEMTGCNNRILVADLTNQISVDAMVGQLPKLNGVIHCAGVGRRVLCKSVTRSDIDSVIGTNFSAPVLLQAALLTKKKIDKGASIVFIASHGASSPAIANSLYSASKGALLSYASCLALELAPRGIRVNCISPGMVWTDLILKDGVDTEMLKADEKHYPLGRYGKPDDIAPLAIYLMSDASSWMTTTNIKINGGGELTPL